MRTVYLNRTAQTTTLSNHLLHHEPIWEQRCMQLGIVRRLNTTRKDVGPVQKTPFTPDGLVHYLIKWIAVNDQVSFICQQCTHHSYATPFSLLVLLNVKNFVDCYYIVPDN
jgi:hypothetical protein